MQAERSGQYVSTGNNNAGINNTGANNNNTGGDNTGDGDSGDPTLILQPESQKESGTTKEGENDQQNVAELGRNRRRELQPVTPMTWHGG